MAMHFQHDWSPLPGQIIEIRLEGQSVRRGRVEAVMDDGSILWLEAAGAYPRSLFERVEGYEAWIDYKWERPLPHAGHHESG